MVNVRKIADMGAYVKLVEYNDIDGMILLSELSRRRIRSINKIIRIGRNEIVLVLRVDKEKGYIDLSKRRVTAEEAAKFDEKFNKSKIVNSILRHVAENNTGNLEDLYTRVGWPLARKYGHAYDAFCLIVNEEKNKVLLDEYTLSNQEKEDLLLNISRRMSPKEVKLRADIEVTCFEYDGIDAVKEALRAGQASAGGESKLSIKLIAPPVYVIITVANDKNKGIEELNTAIAAIKKAITEKKGTLNVVMEARAVSEKDDHALDRLLAEMEEKNREVDGDEDSEEDEDDEPSAK